MGRQVRFEVLENRSLLYVEGVGFNAGFAAPDSCEVCLVSDCVSHTEDVVNLPALESVKTEDGSDFSGIAAEHWNLFLSEINEDETSDFAQINRDNPDLDIDSVDFGVFCASELEEDADLLTNDDDSGPTRSGGSGGGSIVIEPTYSGGGIDLGNSWLVEEGNDVIISLAGGVLGDVVTASISHGTTCSGDFSTFISQVAYTSDGWGGVISLKVAQDSDFAESDETFTVNLSVISENSTLSRTSFAFTIRWTPEFISDVDYESTTPTYNVDTYVACIDSDALIGDELIYKHFGIGVYTGPNNSFSYSIMAEVFLPDNTVAPNDVTNYFQINQSTGVISLKKNAIDYIRDFGGDYDCELTIIAKSNSYSYVSGGGAWDSATVHVSFSHWDIDRNNNEKADVHPCDGATIAMLAQTIGLCAEEFDEWLTFNANTEVTLFNGTTKTCGNLYGNDRLAASSANVFSVPNTIYAAYCFAHIIQNGSNMDGSDMKESFFKWSNRITSFQSLGFYVVTFDNASYSGNTPPTANQKRTEFLNTLQTYSDEKKLHGLYLVSHGTNNGLTIPDFNDNSAPPSFNSNPHNNHGWGPSWNLDYSGGNGFASTNEPNHEADWSIAGALDYHLGAVILHACNGYYSGQVLSSSSNPNTRNSVFFAMPGIATIGDYTWDSLWSQSIFDDHFTHGGKQGTNRY